MSPTQQVLANARQHHEAGRLQQAEPLYRQVVRDDGNCADAWALLGDLCRDLARPEEAVDCYQHAQRLNPRNAEAHYRLGVILMEQGRLDQAVASFRWALRLRTNYPEAYSSLGVALTDQGNLDEAVASLRKAIDLQASDPEARNNLGIALMEQENFSEAEEQFRRAVRFDPEHTEAWHNLGNALSAQDKLDEARAAYERAIRLRPDYVKAHVNLGSVLQSLGLHEEAAEAYQQAGRFSPNAAEIPNEAGISFAELGELDQAANCFRRVLELEPDHPEAHNNLAITLVDQGHVAEAVALLRQALRIQPDYPEAYNNLGNALSEQRKMEEAVAAYEEARRLRPDYAEAHFNLGLCRGGQGRLDDAIALYEEAVRLEPDYVAAWNNLGNCYKDQGRLDEATAAYREAIRNDPENSSLHSNLLYGLHYHPGHDAAAIFQEHLAWAGPLEESLADVRQHHENEADPRRRLRVGYVSPDFRAHVMGSYGAAVIAAHDREKFEIFCYAEVANEDDVSERIRESADAWRVTVNASDDEVAEWIREDKIDILVDFAGHTGGNRLPVFARKPAPVQAAHFGYMSSTGLAAMDYRITDAVADPTGMTERHHTEQLVRLPEIWSCYALRSAPDVGPPPATHAGHVTFGSFNNPTKINARLLELWARVLTAVPGSRMHILTAGTGGKAAERVLETLAHKGIDGGRITLLNRCGRDEYCQRIGAVDVCLDTYPYTGANTTADALWMGVPVVTLAGKTCTTRQSATVLAHLGLQDLIAETPEDYVATGVRLAGDLPRLVELRRQLRERMSESTLTNVARFTRQLEDAYRQMWENWCSRRQSVKPTQFYQSGFVA